MTKHEKDQITHIFDRIMNRMEQVEMRVALLSNFHPIDIMERRMFMKNSDLSKMEIYQFINELQKGEEKDGKVH